jgi:hypothetical protein
MTTGERALALCAKKATSYMITFRLAQEWSGCERKSVHGVRT